MAHGAILARNGNMPARLCVGVAENHFLYGGLLLRNHGNSFSQNGLARLKRRGTPPRKIHCEL
jgi:hypothetical protein